MLLLQNLNSNRISHCLLIVVVLCTQPFQKIFSQSKKTNVAFAQKANEKKRFFWKIQQVSIADTFLVKAIENFIAEKKQEDTLFRNFGYIKVVYGKNQFEEEAVQVSYTLIKSYYPYFKNASDVVYPQCYTFVSGKLVEISSFLNTTVLNLSISKKSKKRYYKLISDYLEPPQKIKFTDNNGKTSIVKNFRVDHLAFHQTWEVYILKNKPPVIVKH